MTSPRQRQRAARALWVAALTVLWSGGAAAQAPPPLFRSDSVLPITLRTDLRTLLRDKDTLAFTWRDATISYAEGDSQVTLPIKVHTRGGYRLLHCEFPPIRLGFDDSTTRGTLLRGLRRPKLVTHCAAPRYYDQFTLQEYAIYRVLRLFTPVSLSARLLRVTYEDVNGKMDPVTRWAFVTEDPERLVRRLRATALTQQGMKIGTLSPSHAALLGVFEYFIGNTDWSMPGLHNIALLRLKDTTYAVPFDFDWAGVVETPYAKPAPILPTSTVRERIYRGYCQGPEALEPVLARFEALRDSIVAIYRGLPDLEPRRLERTERYYDEFYRAIADRNRFAQRVVRRDCIP